MNKKLQIILQKAVQKYPYKEIEVDGFMSLFLQRVMGDKEATEKAKEKAKFALQQGLFKKEKVEDPRQIKLRKMYIKRLINKAIKDGVFTKLQSIKLKKQYANK
jgi:hypothetical protein